MPVYLLSVAKNVVRIEESSTLERFGMSGSGRGAHLGHGPTDLISCTLAGANAGPTGAGPNGADGIV